MTFHKYHAKKTVVDGITFASKKEAERYVELKALLRAQKISDLKLQVPYVLIDSYRTKDGKTRRKRTYVADFVYFDRVKNEQIVEDVKGFRTDVYTLKRDLMYEKYGIEIQEV